MRYVNLLLQMTSQEKPTGVKSGKRGGYELSDHYEVIRAPNIFINSFTDF